MTSFERQVHFWAHMLDEAFCKETDWSSVSKDYIGKRDKQDEWYTSEENAKKIIEPFKNHLRGQKIYCNCDDPEWSGVYKLLYSKFKEWGLAKLVSTGYGAKYKAVVTPETYDDPSKILQENPGNGDMNSEDSLAEARAADIIVSNPPFSRPEEADDNLFRNWVKIAFNCNCGLIGIGMTRAVKENFISEKIMQDELFVYYCPRYKFGRSGENIENSDGKKKETVQVSIYSTFNENLNYGPPLKFNSKSYLENLPTTEWNGQQIPITVNDLGMTNTSGKLVKDNALSRSIIPPPTRQNLGKFIAMPFSVIDLDWKKYFSLVGFIHSPIVTLSDGETKNAASAVVMKYEKATAPDQEVVDSTRNLTADNYDVLMQKMKKKADILVAQQDVDQLRKMRSTYAHSYQEYKNNPGLKQKFYKEIHDYVSKATKMLIGYMSSANDYVDAAYQMYNTSKMTIDEKLKYASKMFNSLKQKRFYKNHPDKNTNSHGSNITLEEIQNVTDLVRLMSACLRFNQTYDVFNKQVSKEKKGDKYDSAAALRTKDELQKIYNGNILPYLENPYVNDNLKKEIKYKLQRVLDQATSVEDRLPFKTIDNSVKTFIDIVGCAPNEFKPEIFSNLDISKIESIKANLNQLRPTVGMYIIDLGKHPERYEPEIYKKVMQKSIELRQAISDATKACTSLLKAYKKSVNKT